MSKNENYEALANILKQGMFNKYMYSNGRNVLLAFDVENDAVMLIHYRDDAHVMVVQFDGVLNAYKCDSKTNVRKGTKMIEHEFNVGNYGDKLTVTLIKFTNLDKFLEFIASDFYYDFGIPELHDDEGFKLLIPNGGLSYKMMPFINKNSAPGEPYKFKCEYNTKETKRNANIANTIKLYVMTTDVEMTDEQEESIESFVSSISMVFSTSRYRYTLTRNEHNTIEETPNRYYRFTKTEFDIFDDIGNMLKDAKLIHSYTICKFIASIIFSVTCINYFKNNKVNPILYPVITWNSHNDDY